MKFSEYEIAEITDAVANAVDDWVRAGAGTYDELEAVIEAAVRGIATRDDDPD